MHSQYKGDKIFVCLQEPTIILKIFSDSIQFSWDSPFEYVLKIEHNDFHSVDFLNIRF